MDRQLRRVQDLPGPRGLPLVGNGFQFKPANLHLTAERWSREHGEEFRLRIGPREVVVLANPEVIAEVLRDRPEGFRRTSRLAAISKEMGFNGVFSANGESWRHQRTMVMASFDPGHIKSYFPTLLKVTARFAARWRRAAAAGEAFDLQADLMRYTVDVTAGLAFGADINTIESGGDVIQQHLDKVLPRVFKRLMSPFPWWRWLRLPPDRSALELQRAVSGFITQARERLAANPELRSKPRNLIEAMIAARDAQDSKLDDADVAGNVLTMLLAGEDTTANTLAWLIYLLHRNPGALARAREEVRGLGPIEKYEQLAALPTIDACINETMRLKPVAPIIMLETERDAVVAGVQVPKDHLIMCLMRAGAIDERRFPDAQAFDPARWQAGASVNSPKRVSMPFGAGPRLCPGRYLAIHEMKMVMSMLLAGFEIERVDTPDGGDAIENLAFTMAPVGLRLKLSARAA